VADEILLDTGALVALVDRSEKRHADCVAALDKLSGTVVTTEAVVTETLHLLSERWSWQKSCLEFFTRGAFLLAPSSQASLKRVALLMERYRNVPMDYADATLVALGEELETDAVFTLDERGFSVYRLNQRKPFRLIP
jgi:hypothetical protein